VAGRDKGFVHVQGLNAAIGQMNHPVGHVGHDGVVGDDDGERAEFAVNALDGLEHDDAGAHIEGAGGLVAQQHLGPLGDRPSNGHPLLFPAG
jgi:hypothetical protein